MAAKINWRSYGTKLRHYHPMYTIIPCCVHYDKRGGKKTAMARVNHTGSTNIGASALVSFFLFTVWRCLYLRSVLCDCNCMLFWHCSFCLLYDVRMSHLANITYIVNIHKNCGNVEAHKFEVQTTEAQAPKPKNTEQNLLSNLQKHVNIADCCKVVYARLRVGSHPPNWTALQFSSV